MGNIGWKSVHFLLKHRRLLNSSNDPCTIKRQGASAQCVGAPAFSNPVTLLLLPFTKLLAVRLFHTDDTFLVELQSD